MKDKNLFGEEFEHKDPSGNQLPNRNKSGGYIKNPLHTAFGKKEDKKCKHCFHLVRKRYGKTYYKCELRGNVDTHSVKSDHKANWTACGKFLDPLDPSNK